MLNKSIKRCPNCKKDTIHYGEKHKFNTGLHVVMTILTGAMWLIPFFFYWLGKRNHVKKWYCSECK